VTRERALWITVAVAVVAGLTADLLIGTYTTGLMMGLGFLGCAALILGAKALQARVLKRPEDYYDDLARRTGFADDPDGDRP
jgi:hypothetical protein